MWFLLFLGGLGIVALAALGEYIGGRILLPSLGLGVPGYWTWFWTMFWTIVFTSPLWFIKSILKAI